MFHNGVQVGKWHDKCTVNYFTTEFGNEIVIFTNNTG